MTTPPPPDEPYPGQQPPYQHGPQQYGQRPYGSPPQGYAQGPPVVAPRKRRRVWPWVLLTVVLVPVLLFVGCTALVGGAVSSVQAQRAGGTVKIGETFTYPSGFALTVSPLAPHKSTNPYIVGADETAYQGTVTMVNGTKSSVGAALLTINATVGSTAAERLFDGLPLTSADVPPGQKLDVPFQIKVKRGTTGDLRISVTAELNEPVYFTGKL
jgi:hypothetical protein